MSCKELELRRRDDISIGFSTRSRSTASSATKFGDEGKYYYNITMLTGVYEFVIFQGFQIYAYHWRDHTDKKDLIGIHWEFLEFALC